MSETVNVTTGTANYLPLLVPALSACVGAFLGSKFLPEWMKLSHEKKDIEKKERKIIIHFIGELDNFVSKCASLCAWNANEENIEDWHSSFPEQKELKEFVKVDCPDIIHEFMLGFNRTLAQVKENDPRTSPDFSPHGLSRRDLLNCYNTQIGFIGYLAWQKAESLRNLYKIDQSALSLFADKGERLKKLYKSYIGQYPGAD